MKKTIVLVEDILDWQEEARSHLESLGAVTVLPFPYEFDFVSAIPEFEKNPPALFVIDFMVPWTEPALEMPDPPSDVAENGYHRAGFRCQTRLAQSAVLKNIPVIFWTIITRDDLEKELAGPLPSNCYYVSKDENISELGKRAKSLINA